MMSAQPVPFGALLNINGHYILSASPELFFHQRGREITVRPMKGTALRGTTPEEDDRLAAALAADPKNRAENIMIVDLLRNDLGRIAEFGSIHATKLFAVERLPAMLQMTSELRATLRADVTPHKLFAALFPSGSIIGAPKVRSMQLIRALEQRTRGPYTGAIGFFSPHGESVFSVAIRTVTLAGNELTMGVGSGVVADSTAPSEYRECLLKASFLRDPAFGLIETMRCENNRIALLALHLDRLCASAARFHFRFDRTAIEAAIAQQITPLDAAPHRIRLVLHADGSAQFDTPAPIAPDTALLRIALWPEPIDATNDLLRHKSTRRALYDRAYTQAREHSLADFLFLNQRGHITEGAIHNVFLRHGSQWRTPPLTDGALPGVYRRHLLSTQPNIRPAHLTLADLRSADEIWLTNALRGIRKVTLSE
jgi:para-aminobenzoate synthetase/4-amino-4-deoxychorismate lyase